MAQKKTRRSKPHLIRILPDQQCRVTAAEWDRLLKAGYIAPVWIAEEKRPSHRLARLRRGVVAEIVEGRLRLQNLITDISAWVFTSWYLIKEEGLSGGELQREIQRQYAPELLPA